MTVNGKDSPLLLAFATSEKVASVCVAAGDNCLAVVDSDSWLQHQENPVGKSTALISLIQHAMKEAEVDGSQLAAIALTNGPGSFTGLRVGVVAARMLCYAWKLPVIVVNSLEVAADKLRRERELSSGDRIWAVTDAQRRQVFAACFGVHADGTLSAEVPQRLFQRQELLDEIDGGDHVTGTGALAFCESLASKCGSKVAEAELAACDANGVATLARKRLTHGVFDDLLAIEPIYFRPSAAEEVRMAKEIAK